jgi:hypothetical protein
MLQLDGKSVLGVKMSLQARDLGLTMSIGHFSLVPPFAVLLSPVDTPFTYHASAPSNGEATVKDTSTDDMIYDGVTSTHDLLCYPMGRPPDDGEDMQESVVIFYGDGYCHGKNVKYN